MNSLSTTATSELRLSGSVWVSYLERRLEAELESRRETLTLQVWPRPTPTPRRRLSPEVSLVVHLFAQSRTAPEIVEIIGSSESTINRRLGIGLAVLGINRMSLPLLHRILTSIPDGDCPRTFEITIAPTRAWSRSEHDCVVAALSGLGVEELALRRGRSPATVRKQLLHAAHKQGYLDMQTLSARVPFLVQSESLGPKPPGELLDPSHSRSRTV